MTGLFLVRFNSVAFGWRRTDANPVVCKSNRSVHPDFGHVATDAVAGDGLLGAVRILRVGTGMAIAAMIVVVLRVGRHRTMRIVASQTVEPLRRAIRMLPRFLELKTAAERQTDRSEPSQWTILRLDVLWLEHGRRAVTLAAAIDGLHR